MFLVYFFKFIYFIKVLNLFFFIFRFNYDIILFIIFKYIIRDS